MAKRKAPQSRIRKRSDITGTVNGELNDRLVDSSLFNVIDHLHQVIDALRARVIWRDSRQETFVCAFHIGAVFPAYNEATIEVIPKTPLSCALPCILEHFARTRPRQCVLTDQAHALTHRCKVKRDRRDFTSVAHDDRTVFSDKSEPRALGEHID